MEVSLSDTSFDQWIRQRSGRRGHIYHRLKFADKETVDTVDMKAPMNEHL